jgi:hypothetical protein
MGNAAIETLGTVDNLHPFNNEGKDPAPRGYMWAECQHHCAGIALASAA